MTDDDGFTKVERLLLMAAAIHDLGPQTNLQFANGHKVVGQALVWGVGLDGALRKAWESYEYHREIKIYYGTLIAMARRMLRDGASRPPMRPGAVLFEGSGNLGTPEEPGSFPHFTAFRLSEYGAEVARLLLERNPQYVQGEWGADS